MYRLTNKRGYTLTELMVTVAIIGIVAAIGVPSYLSYLPHLRLNGAVRDLMSDFRLARSLAVGQSQNHYITFDKDSDWYEIRRSSDGTVVRQRVDYRNPSQGRIGIDLLSILDKNNNPVTEIEFDSNGTASIGKGTANSTNMPVTITIQRSDAPTDNKRINVTRFGRVYAG